MKNYIKYGFIAVVICFLSGCYHKETKKIKVYYSSEDYEVINIDQKVQNDNGVFQRVILINGCLHLKEKNWNIRCGVTKFEYCR